MDIPPRIATVVLVTRSGQVVGQLPPIAVSTPWWQDAKPVVQAVAARDGIAITVLRLLSSDRPRPHGGGVTYLAEVDVNVSAAPWRGQLDDDPLRQAWARPGGPAADLAWADAALRARGISMVGPAEQVRTWNLSSIWRLPTDRGLAWLKVVPPFFAHEAAVIRWLAAVGAPVPTALANDGPRILMADIAGEDRYDADRTEQLALVTRLVDLQDKTSARTAELLDIAVPDRRLSRLAPLIAEVVERAGAVLPAPDRRLLDAFVRTLPARIAEVEGCGLPDVLIHGDFHPGNARGSRDEATILDWGDSAIAHPLLDEPAFLDRVPAADRAVVAEHWHRRWAAAVPGSEPARAARLLEPVATVRLATVYQGFLDAIEPSERVYHAADPAAELVRAARLLATESDAT